MFAVNDRAVVTGPEGSPQAGKAGVVQGVSTFGELYPDVIAHQEARKTPLKNPADPAEQIVAVLLDSEQRPRNFRLVQLKKEGE